MGQAFEIYLGQYGDYYPGGHSWRLNAENTSDWWMAPGRAEKYSSYNPEDGQYQTAWVWSSSGWQNNRNLNGISDISLIGQGTWGGDGGFRPRDTTTLKVAPWGMGLLLSTGALPEPRSYYCPSGADVSIVFDMDGVSGSHGGGSPRADATLPGEINFYEDRARNDMNDNIRDWMRAGGLTARTLTHGDWWRTGRRNMAGYEVFSQYSYRNQPIFVRQQYGWGREDPHPVIYTRPVVMTEANTPNFKTPRQLRTRALVSDMWHKGGRVTEPGAGMKIHKDGYNVLYGDYSVRWYGDAEQRFIWWDHVEAPAALSYANPATGLYHSKHYYPHPAVNQNPSVWKQVPLVWHTLDRFNGMDLEVDAGEYTVDWRTQVGLPYRDMP